MSKLGKDTSHCCSQRRDGLSRIYALLFDGKLRYIGQTTHSLACRLGRHLAAANKQGRKSHVCCWIRGLSDLGYKPEMVLLQSTSAQFSDCVERFWISFYRKKGCDLVNFSEGGNMCGMLGKNHTFATRKKMSEKATGRKLSAETIAKIVSKITGRKQSQEEKDKRAEKLRGKKRTPERRKAQSEWMLLHARRKSVAQCDLLGNVLKIFPSIREAAKFVDAPHPLISRAAKIERYTCRGFKWRYQNVH